MAKWAAERGIHVHQHAASDRAAAGILDCFEAVNKDIPIAGLRWQIAHIENAQPTVRTLTFVKGLSGARARLQAADPAQQPVPRILVIDRVTKFDPCRGGQKCGQATALRSFCTRQENRNHAETSGALADAR